MTTVIQIMETAVPQSVLLSKGTVAQGQLQYAYLLAEMDSCIQANNVMTEMQVQAMDAQALAK